MNALRPEPIVIACVLEPSAQTALAEAAAQAAGVQLDEPALSMLIEGRAALHVVQASRLGNTFTEDSSEFADLNTEGRIDALQNLIDEDPETSEPLDVTVAGFKERPIGEGRMFFYALNSPKLSPQYARLTGRINAKSNTRTRWPRPNNQLGVGSFSECGPDKVRLSRAFRRLKPKGKPFVLLGGRAMKASSLRGESSP